ncbi:MAG: DUF4350 domain-containing protein [Dermatophilaceae bacterium]
MSGSVWQDADLQAAGIADAQGPEHPTVPSSPRRRRLVLAGVLGSLVLAALLVSWGRGAPPSSIPYDPENPAFNGAQALARVLAAQGVEVVVARGEDDLRRADVDGDTTVVVSLSAPLREPTVRSMAALTRSAERLVLVRPERRVVRQLAPEVSVRDTYRESLVSACDTADVRPGETLSASQAEYLQRLAPTACFVTEGYAVYLQVSGSAQHAPLVLLGSTDLVTNQSVADDANAAIALRTLGHSSRLVWYMPDLQDAPLTSQEQSEQLLPDWFGPMVLLGGFAVVAVMLWRGRRLGRLVVERLPVVIRAVETTESRGRLYRKARDTARAAQVLRDATIRRLTAYLSLAPTTPPDAVTEAVAQASGWPTDRVRWLLTGPLPTTETDLLGLAVALSTLEKETARP